ncbi:hypothetical protein SEMRO_1345_G264760.1 [Seminavis robusta]|uniref:Uncharacterized protein n=1 Tax=Seminavis robusta TaxID=568900 RepID=A0A9N8HS47_9STRA|nr:hypothetical protein SEMRO_1345_G264760.1 [Seminavis robusta]|eukprot:Sro1345_g264760.1 n/a (102) ;mRNA; r:7161-7466
MHANKAEMGDGQGSSALLPHVINSSGVIIAEEPTLTKKSLLLTRDQSKNVMTDHGGFRPIPTNKKPTPLQLAKILVRESRVYTLAKTDNRFSVLMDNNDLL